MTDGGFLWNAVPLADVGGGNTVIAQLLGWDFDCFAIVDFDHIGDGAPVADPKCRRVAHEQTGPLPLEIVKRIAITNRNHRED